MFDELEFDAEQIPGYKLGVHIVQIILSLIAWSLEIAVFRAKDAKVTGQNGWAFAVCFLSAPAWIYLIGAPRYPRTRKLAEPHVMVAVDVLYCLLWLSAFAAQASYNSAGKCGDGCSPSKAIVAMGVFETLLFGLTSFISIYTLKFYQFNNRLPGYDRLGVKKGHQNIDPDMAAFSTAPHDEEPYARINNMDADYDQERQDPPDYSYGGASSYGGGGLGATTAGATSGYGDGSAYGGSGVSVPHDNPFDDTRRTSYLDSNVGTTNIGSNISNAGSGLQPNPFDDPHAGADNNLRPAASAASLGTSATGHTGYHQPTVQDAYDDDRPVQFPQADYDRH